MPEVHRSRYRLAPVGALVSLAAIAGALSAQEGQPFVPGCTLPFAEIAAHHPIDDDCGRAGKRTPPPMRSQNLVKNNFCAQGAPMVVTHSGLAQLEAAYQAHDPSGGRRGPPQDRSAMRKLGEGRVVQLAAFLIGTHVLHGESVNCQRPGAESNDIIIALGESPGSDSCQSIRAEISPHARPNEWDLALLNHLDRPVRITGQLFYDATHRPCVEGHPQAGSPERLSVWEIHPVYAVEVCTGATLADCPAGDPGKWGPLDRRLAQNAAGLELLKRGRSEQAVQVFAGVEGDFLAASDLTAADKSRFLYNYGLALREDHRPAEAARRFLRARELDADFSAPVEAILVETIMKLPASERRGVSETLPALIALLTQQGDLANAGAALRLAFMQLKGGVSYDRLPELLLGYLTAAEVGPRQFRKEWETVVSESLPAMGEQARARAGLLQRAYLSDLPVVLDRARADELTAPWQGHSRDFARFLTVVGKALLGEGSTAAALARYTLAWSSGEDIEAAIQISALVLRSPRQVDPDGSILESLIRSIFERKEVAYGTGDWRAIFRLHNLLASIFENQGKWGNEGDPRSAIFQLKHALWASSHLEAKEVALLDAVPGLHARLARSYGRAGHARQAVEEYLASARAYLASGRPGGAETVLVLAADNLSAPADPVLQKEIDALSAKAREAQNTKGVRGETEDARITELALAKLEADPDIGVDQIELRTDGGVVTIAGAAVPGKWREIERLVAGIGGVKAVRQGAGPKTP